MGRPKESHVYDLDFANTVFQHLFTKTNAGMATAAPHGNNVPPSAADERLQASLDRIKFASSHYMDNPNNTTQARFSSASEEHVNALQGAGLSRQAGHMRKVDRDFRNATTRSKMLRIVVALARTLVSNVITVSAAERSIGRPTLYQCDVNLQEQLTVARKRYMSVNVVDSDGKKRLM